LQRAKPEHTDDEDGGAENAEPDQVLKKRALPEETVAKGEEAAAVEKRQVMDVEQGQQEVEYTVRAVRLKSRDRKGTSVKICGFEIDGWII
jgi:hypothetical protein